MQRHACRAARVTHALLGWVGCAYHSVFMRNRPLIAQEPYLDQLCREQADVTVFLLNGMRLRGRLTQFDNHALLLSDRWTSQVVYKHSVSTIVPFAPLRRVRAGPNQ